MQFVYHEDAGEKTLNLTGNTFIHLFKARRKASYEALHVRNLQDNNLYKYNIAHISKKTALLDLQSFTSSPKISSVDFTLGWSIIEPKIIEKTLPMLNEIGVSTIAFVYTDFSQKNFTLDMNRLRKIAIHSCEQCGRSSLIEFKVFNSLKEYFQNYPQSFILDFSSSYLQSDQKPKSVLVGCEGGFSQKEKETFKKDKIIGLNSPFILKSQSAASAISSKILL